jgi:hypothetical protein
MTFYQKEKERLAEKEASLENLQVCSRGILLDSLDLLLIFLSYSRMC